MRKNTFCRLLISIFLCLFFVGVSLGQAKYEELMDKADALVKSGSFVEAFSVAQQAIKLEANQFTAYYYAAFSLYKRGLLAEAEPYAKDALSRATVTDKATCQKLLDTIAGIKVFNEQVLVGDQAIETGLFNKAAIAYTRAFDGNPVQVEIGMKAVDLLLNRVNNPLEAARLLKMIVDQNTNQDASKRAKILLGTITSRVQRELDAQYEEANRLIADGKNVEAIEKLSKLAKNYQTYTNPNGYDRERELHLKLVKLYALQKQNSEAIAEFAEVVKRSPAGLNTILYDGDYLDDIVFDPGFAAFIGDSFGPTELNRIKLAVDSTQVSGEMKRQIENHYKNGKESESQQSKTVKQTGGWLNGTVDTIKEVEVQLVRTYWITSVADCGFTFNYEFYEDGKKQKDSSGSFQVSLTVFKNYLRHGETLKFYQSKETGVSGEGPEIVTNAINNAIRMCRRNSKNH